MENIALRENCAVLSHELAHLLWNQNDCRTCKRVDNDPVVLPILVWVAVSLGVIIKLHDVVSLGPLYVEVLSHLQHLSMHVLPWELGSCV